MYGRIVCVGYLNEDLIDVFLSGKPRQFDGFEDCVTSRLIAV